MSEHQEAKAKKPFRIGELVESVEHINSQLLRDYGRELDGRPKWRVVWSDDQLEKRWMTHTNEGFELINPEVREVRKYSHINEKYVLERLVPVVGETDLVSSMSYEPVWTFEDRFFNYLPPRFDACKFIIEMIYDNVNKKNSHKKYKDDSSTPEARQKLINEMEYKLFGNETPVGDALAHKSGIVVPGKEKR